MGLLKDFLRIEADRRGALAALRLEAQSRRLQIDEIGAEAKRKRDEVAMIEEGLRRLAEDVARTEEELLEIESRREDHDREAHDHFAGGGIFPRIDVELEVVFEEPAECSRMPPGSCV